MSCSMQWKKNDKTYRSQQNARAKANRERKALYLAANPERTIVASAPTQAKFIGLTRAGRTSTGYIPVDEVDTFVKGKKIARWQSLSINGEVKFGSLIEA